jgi:hypothetical protein
MGRFFCCFSSISSYLYATFFFLQCINVFTDDHTSILYRKYISLLFMLDLCLQTLNMESMFKINIIWKIFDRIKHFNNRHIQCCIVRETFYCFRCCNKSLSCFISFDLQYTYWQQLHGSMNKLHKQKEIIYAKNKNYQQYCIETLIC